MKRLVCALFVGTGLAIAPTISALAAYDAAGSGDHSMPAQQLPFWVAQATDQTGTVEFFNESKGFGSIKPSDGSQSVFVHFSAIQGNGFRTLTQGQKVRYDTEAGAKGPQAVNVRPF